MSLRVLANVDAYFSEEACRTVSSDMADKADIAFRRPWSPELRMPPFDNLPRRIQHGVYTDRQKIGRGGLSGVAAGMRLFGRVKLGLWDLVILLRIMSKGREI